MNVDCRGDSVQFPPDTLLYRKGPSKQEDSGAWAVSDAHSVLENHIESGI